MAELKERRRNNWWELVSICFIFFLLAIFPLMYGPNKYADITEFKFNAFKRSTLIYFGVCFCIFLYALFARMQHIFAIRNEEIRFRITLPQVLVFAYVLWTWISAWSSEFPLYNVVTSPNGKTGHMDTWIGFGRYEGVYSAMLYGFLFICLSFWGEFSDKYFKGIAVSAFIFSFIGFLQFFKDGVIYPKNYTFWEARFVSTLGNVDMVGGYVAMILPILFCMYIFSENKYWGYAHLASMIFLTFIFSMAEVDSGKVGLLIGFTVAVVYLIDTEEKLFKTLNALSAFVFALFLRYFFNLSKEGFNFTFNKKVMVLLFGALVLFGVSYLLKTIKFKYKYSPEKIRKYGFLVLCALIFVVLVCVFFYKGNSVLIKEASEVLHFKLSDGAGSGRGYIWKSALKLAVKKPFAGYGPGSFGDVYKYVDNLPTYTDFAHNDFVQIAVCTGFVGVLLYVAFCASLAVRAFKNITKCKYILILGTACLSYLVHSFFSFSIAIITPIFWALAGLLDKVIRQVEDNTK